MNLPNNLSTADRVIRTIVALVLLALSLSGVISGVVGIIAIVLAVVFLATAAVGFCPLYFPFHFSTKTTK